MNKKDKEKIVLPAGVTPEMLKAWQERYGIKKVKLATLRDDDNVFEPFNVIIRRQN